MDERIAKLLASVGEGPGASEAAIARLWQYVGADLPPDYLDFLYWRNGWSGFLATGGVIGEKLDGKGLYITLYSAEEIPELSDLGAAMHPDFLDIGDSGDSTFSILLDTTSRDPETMEFAQFDPSGYDEGIEYRTASFSDLLEHRATAFAALSGADLRNADLRSAHLYNADLSGANLSGADLSDADLRNANLSGANLRETNLTGADLYGAVT